MRLFAIPIEAPGQVPDEELDLGHQDSSDLSRPDWHREAACRGDGADKWCLPTGVGGSQRLGELRRVCAGCPVAGDCLREALGEEPLCRLYGAVRLGLAPRSWSRVRAMVRELELESADDLGDLAALLLDGLVLVTRRGVELVRDEAA